MEKEKITVLNPITYFNTIGQELKEIASSNDVVLTDILFQLGLEIKDLSSLTRINKSDTKTIEKNLKIEGLSEYLIDFQKNYTESKKESDKVYFDNKKIYRKVKHIESLLNNEFEDGIDKLEDISNFLGIEDENEIFDKVNENIALYKIANFKPDNLNLYSWLKRGELDFRKKELSNYDKKGFISWIKSGEYLNNFQNIEYIKTMPKELEKFGIGLIYTEYIKKTVHGAVRWFDKKPLIQLSDKNKCLATFWYTLFHEFGHVIMHENDEIFEGNLDLPQSKINQKEKEANSFAYKYLFNGDGLRKHLFSIRNTSVHDDFIANISSQFHVHEIFVAYWMKKALIKSLNTSIYSIKFDLNTI